MLGRTFQKLKFKAEVHALFYYEKNQINNKLPERTQRQNNIPMKYILKIFKKEELLQKEEFEDIIEAVKKFQLIPEHENAIQIWNDLSVHNVSKFDYSIAVLSKFTNVEIPFAIKYCNL